MEVKKRKGFFFSTDALLALGIFVIALILLLQLRPASAPSFKEPIIADDIIMALSAIRVNETSSPTVKNMISAQEIRPEQLGISIAELLAELWSEDNTIIAEQIIIEVTSTLSSKYQVAFSVNQDDLFGFSEEDSLRTVALGTRIVTGINRSQPTRGYSAHIQFSLPKNRTTSSFAYFGGFSGQGDLEVMLRDLPSDLDSSNIISLSMEAAISQEVTIFVNNNVCGTFPAEPLSKRSQYFNLSSCIPALLPGYNRVRLSFEELETAFVGGGFVQVKYTTNEIAVPTVGQGTYHFPDIYGIINVYDSITIPGNLTSLEIYLEYDALIPPNVETTYFLNIGNATVYSGTNMTSESVTLTDADFSMLDYSSMSGTIPIRMGIEGVNYSGYVTVDNPSDTIIITDLSGSMAWCGDTEPPLTCTYDCRYQMWFWQFTTEKSCQVESVDACAGDVCGGTPTCTSTSNHDACRPRVEIAKEAALIAQDLILTNELARVGLIAYSTGIVSELGLTDNQTAVVNEIESYEAGGWTCMCCGIYRAVDMYSNFSENHSYMIILSDGEVNYRCDGPGSYTGVLDLSPASAQSTVEAGQYACENNISVFVIAAGPDLEPEWTETLKEVACDESMYFETSDFSELSSIYENVTREILSRTTYTSQIVHPGEGLASNLTNSYITYHYESNINPLSINEIPITKRTSKLNYCNASVLLNPNLRVIESYITSYSDEHWTSLVGINDQTVFNISNYGSNFNLIGDPFIVGIPGDLFSHGNNSIAVLTGSAPGNETGCSPDNIIVLSTAVSIIPPISPVASKAEGCHWHVLQENLESFETSIPSYYSGSKNCYYHNSTYDIDDAYDISAYSLFSQLDIDNNGMIDIYLTEQALTVESIVVENVPSLWGPAIFEVKVGR